jgi:hypothetical protein
MRGAVSPLATWFAGPSALARFRARRLGRAPVVLRPRDGAWRTIAPDFATTLTMARAGLPFQIAAARRYDRSSDPRRLRAALGAGATVFFPQIHQVLPRLVRLMVAIRMGLTAPLREETSFLFAVEGRGRIGMGLHHDGPVDAFWLQLEGRRTVTLGPPVRPGTGADLDPHRIATSDWRTIDLTPGTLFHLPPWTPHDVVCHGRSLALSLTWRTLDARGRRASPARRRAAAVEWDVVTGRVDAIPPASRTRLWTQVPLVVGPRRGREIEVVSADGTSRFPVAARAIARALALMPSITRPRGARQSAAVASLIAAGLLGARDLPLRIVPDDVKALDGWRFA